MFNPRFKLITVVFFGFVFLLEWAGGCVWASDELELPEKITREKVTQLRSLSGEVIPIPPTQGHLVVCFLGTECPLGKLYVPRLKAIAKEFSASGFQFVAVNSNQQDSTQEWREFIESVKWRFPGVKDFGNRIADQLRVRRNPEVMVIDSAGDILYRGRIDDQHAPGIQGARASREDLKIALTEISQGKPVRVPQTEPTGCLIGRVKKPNKIATVTYARDIAPIFQKNCVECHRPGEIGPFAMVDYDEVVGWADMILETIDNGRMPPWHADPQVGHFDNSRGLSDHEKQLVRTWVDEGAQLGNPDQLPAPIQYTSGWRLPRKPDLVLPMRRKPFRVPAEGTVDYQYFVVDPEFTEDKWVSAAEIIPGDRSVLHHSIVFIRPPDGGRAIGMNWLEAYVPGKVPGKYLESRARKIPAGSKLVFQQHYTPNGKPTEDLTKIGLVFVDENQVAEEIVTLAALNQEFEIEPYQANLTVKATIPWLPSDGRLLSIAPHMHFRGKSFVAKAKWAAGANEVGDSGVGVDGRLLHVPKYDFNWQHVYEFSNALPLNAIDEIEMEVTFDNSKSNLFNPDPSQYVVWGDQTWEEMAVGFFNVAIPRRTGTSAAPPAGRSQQVEERPATTPIDMTEVEFSAATLRKAKRYAERLFEKNDNNGDGELVLDELEFIVKRNFGRYDHNQDGRATFDEVEAAARRVYHRMEN